MLATTLWDGYRFALEVGAARCRAVLAHHQVSVQLAVMADDRDEGLQARVALPRPGELEAVEDPDVDLLFLQLAAQRQRIAAEDELAVHARLRFEQRLEWPHDELHHRLFYAHLYLGLYYDSLGDKKQALEHMTRAAGDYKISHYMGDVARVHRDILQKAQ